MPRTPQKPAKPTTKPKAPGSAKTAPTKAKASAAKPAAKPAAKAKPPGAGAAPAKPQPKPWKLGPQDPEGNTALKEPKKDKIRPTRTLTPVTGSGQTETKPPREPDDWRLQQWPRSAPQGVFNAFGWDVESVLQALANHAIGNPRMTGMLLDDLKINPIIGHGIEVRQEAWRTLPRQVLPGGYGPRGGEPPEDFVRFADFWREALPDILPDGTMDDIWLHTNFMGESLCAIDWEERTDGRDRWWLPYVKPWHPSQMYHYYRPDKGERTPDGTVLAAITRDRGPLIVEPGFGRWMYISRGTLQPWLNGLVRTLAEVFLGDTYTLRDNFALQERYGQGVVKFFHPTEWAQPKIDNAQQTIYASGKGGVIPFPMTADGKRRGDAELLSPSTAGAGLFDMTEKRVIRRILIALLGQDMTTVGQTGGFAQAAIHSQVLWHKRERDAATFGDAKLINYLDEQGKPRRRWLPYNGPIRSQLARWVAYFNVGAFEAAPYTYWDATPPEDVITKEKEEAQTGQFRAAAFASLSTGLIKDGAFDALKMSEADLEQLLLQCGLRLRAPKSLLPDDEDKKDTEI